jgi:predicted enzyme related to lactoylglutathione lyase
MARSVFEGVTIWHEFMCLDRERSEAFYREVAQLSTAPVEVGPVTYTLWLQDGRPVGALVPLGAEREAWPSGSTPHWLTSFAVDDVDHAVDKALKLGAEVLMAPVDIPEFGRAAILRDPEGAAFGLFQRPK